MKPNATQQAAGQQTIRLKLYAVALLVMLTMVSLSAAAAEGAGGKQFWLDRSGTSTFEQVREIQFTPFEGALAEGYSSAALWVKLNIPAQLTAEKLAIVVKPALLQRVELYDPASPLTSTNPVISGRAADIDSLNHIGLENGFVIPPSLMARDVYIRIKTNTSLIFDVQLLRVEDATRQSNVLYTILIAFVTFSVTISSWSIIYWRIKRDYTFLFFAFRQLYSTAFLFVYFGTLRSFTASFLDEGARELIYTIVICTTISVTTFFDAKILKDASCSKFLISTSRLIAFAPAISILLILSNHQQTALFLNSCIVILAFSFIVMAALSAKGDPRNRYNDIYIILVKSGFVFMGATIIIPGLAYQGWLNIGVPILSVMVVQAFISTLILLSILLIQNRQQEMTAQNNKFLLQVREVELSLETARRVEKERFISMLTHELRNPLSVIQLLSSSSGANEAAVNRAAKEMAEVLARVEESERMDEARIAVKKTNVDVIALLVDIAGRHKDRGEVMIDAPDLCVAETDGDLLRRIIQNLLDNAMKYRATDSMVDISLRVETAAAVEKITLTVTNRLGEAGEPDQDRLFTRYYRNSRAHRAPGSGLGLFLVASWADALGGSITYSKKGSVTGNQYATFSLRLPS